MRNKTAEGHIAMVISKSISGVNPNALKYLIPVWMAPLAGVTFRMVFGCVAFWVIHLFIKDRKPVLRKDILHLLLIGMLGFYSFQACYLLALKYTTPVSASILNSLLPVWTFVISLIFFKERFTWLKTLGLAVSVAGAVLCMFVKRPPELASDPLLGDSLAILSSITFSLYLIFSHRMLDRVSNLTLLKWTFTGAALSALFVDLFIPWDARVLETPLHLAPVLALLFVLIFPTVVSYILLQIGVKYLNTTIVAAYNNYLIVVTLIVSLIVGQDRFSWMQLSSILLLCAGLFFITRSQAEEDRKSPGDKINARTAGVKSN